jgi:hypothetical protein
MAARWSIDATTPMVPCEIGHSDGLTRPEPRGQFPIDAASPGVNPAELENQSLEGTRLGTLTRLGATIT